MKYKTICKLCRMCNTWYRRSIEDLLTEDKTMLTDYLKKYSKASKSDLKKFSKLYLNWVEYVWETDDFSISGQGYIFKHWNKCL